MEYQLDKNCLTLWLAGHIDSQNAVEIEREIGEIRAENPAPALVLDCSGLDYISSAGLRIILHLKRAVPDTSIVNAGAEVYEVLDTTGFTEMMEVHKAYRVLSIEGCEVIGRGANGEVYRIDPDTVVKVYKNPDALPEIHRERELARTAFVLGVPTAIPYDVVRIEGGGYGSVFELLNATNFADLLVRGECGLDEVVKMSVDLLKIIHGTEVKPGSVPSMREVALDWTRFLQDELPAAEYEKLYTLISAVPEDNHLLHGDYHIRNITRQGSENLILDMDTLCHGHPIFELASMYNAYVGFGERDPKVVERFLGIDYETSRAFWRKSLALYLNAADEQTVDAVEEKAMLLGYVRMLRRRLRRDGRQSAEGRAEIEACRSRISELLAHVNSLVF